VGVLAVIVTGSAPPKDAMAALDAVAAASRTPAPVSAPVAAVAETPVLVIAPAE
jgi:hypothetical protein